MEPDESRWVDGRTGLCTGMQGKSCLPAAKGQTHMRRSNAEREARRSRSDPEVLQGLMTMGCGTSTSYFFSLGPGSLIQEMG